MGKSIWDTVEIRRLADMRSYVHKIIKNRYTFLTFNKRDMQNVAAVERKRVPGVI